MDLWLNFTDTPIQQEEKEWTEWNVLSLIRYRGYDDMKENSLVRPS